MARSCTICDHPSCDEINNRLVRGDSIAKIALDFAISEHALRRHKQNHMSKFLEPSYEAKEVAQADSLFDELKGIQLRTTMLLNRAEDKGDIRSCAPLLREMREQIRLMLELEGRLAAQPQINILVNPQWLELRTLIIEALEPFPEAREAVTRVIQ